jgi:DNA-binding IclR family transcriptional regulator
MEKLTAEIHESVYLCVLVNNNAVIIEQTLSNSRLMVNAKIGNSEPLHCSAGGKCLLAFTSDKNREKMIATLSFDVYTEKTIRDKDTLNAEIQRVRELGYAIDNEELSADIRCVAVPVFDERGMCLYSLGASGAASRMTQEKLGRIVPLMLKSARNIRVVPENLEGFFGGYNFFMEKTAE